MLYQKFKYVVREDQNEKIPFRWENLTTFLEDKEFYWIQIE